MSHKVVYNIVEGKDGKSYWTRIGIAFENKDGSLNIFLNQLPLDGKLHVREPKAKNENENYNDDINF
jgi:hypothetical protein